MPWDFHSKGSKFNVDIQIITINILWLNLGARKTEQNIYKIPTLKAVERAPVKSWPHRSRRINKKLTGEPCHCLSIGEGEG